MRARLRLHGWRTFVVGGLPCRDRPGTVRAHSAKGKMFGNAPESLIRCPALTRISHLLRIQYMW